jgi:acetylornithine deacetylase ArgE
MTVDALRLLRELIAIPSVNPMREGTCGDVERGVAEHLEATLRREGIECERLYVSEGRENLIAVVRPSAAVGGARDGLMLCSHMDTVPAENMSIDPFDPTMREGRVYGRGSCDAKGPIASMVAALVAHSCKRERPAHVVFAATVDEEFSFKGAWKLVEREWPVRACVIGEPTRLNVIVAHKGVARWRVKVRGRSAHGATPHLGRSAIYDGARVALALEAYADEISRGAPHPLLGSPTMNVGRVSGGQAVNVVPDLCEFEVERRLLPGEDGREEVRACEEWVRARVGGGVGVTAEEPYLVDPALDTPRDAEVVRAVSEAHADVLGRVCAIEGAHYGTDGSKLALKGIETVVCGPGDIARAHTRDESVEVEQIERAVRLYGRVLEGWKGERGGARAVNFKHTEAAP